MARPRKGPQSGPSGQHKQVGKLIRAPEELWELCKAAAKRDRRTLSDWVRVTLEDAVRKGR